MSLSSNFPTSKPSLNLDFANVGALDPRITFTRSSSATYTNSLGLITTAATNVARFDYDPVTLAARGLLIEESRTNLVTYSEQFDNAAWSTVSTSVTGNAGAAPDGTTTADKIIANATSGDKGIYNSGAITLTAAIYTWSVFAKASGNNFASLTAVSNSGARYAIAVDLTNGTVTQTASAGAPTNTSYFVSNYGNGWYRIGISMTGSASASYMVLSGITTGTPTRNGSTLDPSFTGNGTDGIFIWGAQLEDGSFATSYIPTVASTVTRSADVASVNTLSPWYSSTEGALFADTTNLVPVSYVSLDNSVVLFDDTTTSNWMGLYRSISAPSMRYAVVSGGSTQVDVNVLFPYPPTSSKAAFAYKANDFASTADGLSVTTDTSGTVPTITGLRIGGGAWGSAKFNGYIRRIAYYPRRLTNAELQALTS